jgi:xanthine/uracil permease
LRPLFDSALTFSTVLAVFLNQLLRRGDSGVPPEVKINQD